MIVSYFYSLIDLKYFFNIYIISLKISVKNNKKLQVQIADPFFYNILIEL